MILTQCHIYKRPFHIQEMIRLLREFYGEFGNPIFFGGTSKIFSHYLTPRLKIIRRGVLANIIFWVQNVVVLFAVY